MIQPDSFPSTYLHGVLGPEEHHYLMFTGEQRIKYHTLFNQEITLGVGARSNRRAFSNSIGMNEV